MWLELKSLKTWTSILTGDPVAPLGQWDFIHQGQESPVQWDMYKQNQLQFLLA